MIKTFLIACFLLVLLMPGAQSPAAEGTAGSSSTCLSMDNVPALAQPLSDPPNAQMRPLCAQHYLDNTGAIAPDRMVTQPFHPRAPTGIFPAPLPTQSLWLKFTVFNPHEVAQNQFIAFMETIFDDVILFEERDGALVKTAQNGRTVSFQTRENTSAKMGFPITLQPGDARVFYLRIAGTFEPTVTAVIMSEDLFDDWTTLVLMMTALFLAYVATLALFSLIVFRQIDARFYQYYTLYMLCLFMFSFIYDGWLNTFFGVTLPVTTLTPVTEFFAGLGILANIQYCRILLNVDADTLVWRRLFLSLSAIVVLVTALAVADPWRLAAPLHLIFFVSPIILLVVGIRKIREGLPQAWPLSGSLLSLSLGLSIAVYFFIVPINVTQATYAYHLVLLRPLGWGYYLAISGETLFMMIAISTMVRTMNIERRSAAVELVALGRHVRDIEQDRSEAEKTTSARLEALESALMKDPESSQHLSAKQQFVENATEGVLDHVADQGFGVERLAVELAVSQKTLGRRLKEANGQSPASFIRSVRLSFARNLILLDQYNTVAEVAHASGFSNASNFAKHYRQEFGETPGKSIHNLRKIAKR